MKCSVSSPKVSSVEIHLNSLRNELDRPIGTCRMIWILRSLVMTYEMGSARCQWDLSSALIPFPSAPPAPPVLSSLPACDPQGEVTAACYGTKSRFRWILAPCDQIRIAARQSDARNPPLFPPVIPNHELLTEWIWHIFLSL